MAEDGGAGFALRAGILKRDGHRCVVCSVPADEVLHVFCERLWDDNPDFADNLVTLCPMHKKDALTTRLDVEDLLSAAGIAERPMPPQLHAVERYDRWGNVFLSGGRRARGELFFDEQARRWLEIGDMLQCFTPFVKYPRTFVLPWSDVVGVGDRPLASLTLLENAPVIVTEKMDGENVSLYRNFLHTRTVSRIPHESRVWLDGFWEKVRWQIPEDWRVCGEYLFVRHTVGYRALPSYFMAFSVWNEKNVCLGWHETSAFLDRAGIARVPLLYEGPLCRDAIDRAWRETGTPGSEGYILRSAGSFALCDFRRLTGKFIRAGYQQSEPVKDNIRTGSTFEVNALE